MKKKLIQFIICEALVCGVLLCGCGNVHNDPAQVQEVSEAEVQVESSVAPTAELVEQEETDAAKVDDKQEIEYFSVDMEKPAWEYYIAEQIASDTKPYQLTLLEEKANEIIDTEEWFTKNALKKPVKEVSLDEKYVCAISRNEDTLVVNKTGEYGAELDFSKYLYANEANKIADPFVEEPLIYAVVEDDVLYVSNYHYTYAESEPLNAYITAVSLEDFSVLWRTAPLTCNSRNFVIIGDVIFCGYGFTEETDTLYQLDKKTGEVLASEPLKSMAEYILYQDDKLYVRTYNTDYIFSVEMN